MDRYTNRNLLEIEAMRLRDLTPRELEESLPSILRLQAESDSKCVLTAHRITMAVDRLAEANILA